MPLPPQRVGPAPPGPPAIAPIIKGVRAPRPWPNTKAGRLKAPPAPPWAGPNVGPVPGHRASSSGVWFRREYGKPATATTPPTAPRSAGTTTTAAAPGTSAASPSPRASASATTATPYGATTATGTPEAARAGPPSAAAFATRRAPTPPSSTARTPHAKARASPHPRAARSCRGTGRPTTRASADGKKAPRASTQGPTPRTPPAGIQAASGVTRRPKTPPSPTTRCREAKRKAKPTAPTSSSGRGSAPKPSRPTHAAPTPAATTGAPSGAGPTAITTSSVARGAATQATGPKTRAAADPGTSTQAKDGSSTITARASEASSYGPTSTAPTTCTPDRRITSSGRPTPTPAKGPHAKMSRAAPSAARTSAISGFSTRHDSGIVVITSVSTSPHSHAELARPSSLALDKGLPPPRIPRHQPFAVLL